MLSKNTYLIFLLVVLLAITNSFWFAVKGGGSEGNRNRDTVRVIQRVVIPPDTIYRDAQAVVYYRDVIDTVDVENVKKSVIDSSAISEKPLGTSEAGTNSLAFLAADTIKTDEVDIFLEFHYPEMRFMTRVEIKVDTVYMEVSVECPEVNELSFFEEVWLDYGLPVFGGVLIFAILAA